MRFCPSCGHEVEQSIPPGDNRLRHCCPACSAIHYQNPKMVLGTIPVWEDKVLLCRRAIEPRYGYWTLPAGFMENGESTGEGAARETLEEAGARIALGEPFSILDVPQIEQIHMFFHATMLDPGLDPGPESLEARLFTEAEIPWDSLAFRTVSQTLRWYFEDRREGRFRLHTETIRYQPRTPG
ncbi:MAG TPA: NUDIX hydrolase [Quisquiliibacterium sp.]|jgi:ADP-ribose pyrophosphatase YjhB (NUDIX family)|nr:NUDIX hydrolase [Quisquiliibacterium sp.]